MNIPLNALKKTQLPLAAIGPEGDQHQVTLSLLKRGAKGRIEVKALTVPDDVALAKSRRDNKEDSKEEKRNVKNLVLGAIATANKLREKEEY